jgi:hypothetical protein
VGRGNRDGEGGAVPSGGIHTPKATRARGQQPHIFPDAREIFVAGRTKRADGTSRTTGPEAVPGCEPGAMGSGTGGRCGGRESAVDIAGIGGILLLSPAPGSPAGANPAGWGLGVNGARAPSRQRRSSPLPTGRTPVRRRCPGPCLPVGMNRLADALTQGDTYTGISWRAPSVTPPVNQRRDRQR